MHFQLRRFLFLSVPIHNTHISGRFNMIVNNFFLNVCLVLLLKKKVHHRFNRVSTTKYNEIKWNYRYILGKLDVIFFINSSEYLYYRNYLQVNYHIESVLFWFRYFRPFLCNSILWLWNSKFIRSVGDKQKHKELFIEWFDARTLVRFVERQFSYLNQEKRTYQKCLKGNTNQLSETEKVHLVQMWIHCGFLE